MKRFANFKKLTLLAALCLSLPACGFQPIYGKASASGDPVVAAQMNQVAIASIPDRQGQQLRNHLIDRMYGKGRPSETTATLNVSLRTSEVDLGIQKDSTASRRELNMWAEYMLRDHDGKKLLAGTAHSVVGYSKLSAQYGTLAAHEDAVDRAVKEVAEQIVNRISLYYATYQEEPPQDETPSSEK